MPIRFLSEGIDFKVKNPRVTANWILEAAKREKRSISDIVYTFCSDKYLLKLNKEFLNHDTLTDIITFDYSSSTLISGEIFISVERVQENSLKYKTEFEIELLRVMIHGVLHMVGYNDKKPLELSKMRKKEEAYLSLWKTMFHVKR